MMPRRSRREYVQDARLLCKRGSDLPHAKLTSADIAAIRSAQAERVRLRKMIDDELSNGALAAKYGVHPRTIEKVLARETWVHVLDAQ